MVLIVSHEDDRSSKLVGDWISYSNQKYYLIKASDKVEIISYSFNDGNVDFSFRHDGKIFNIRHFKAIWFRRGWFKFIYHHLHDLELSFEIEEIDKIETYIKEELKTFQEHIYNTFAFRENVFGNVNKYNLNKLDVLTIAKNIGLNVPSFCITTSKRVFLDFYELHGPYILSKAINENINYVTKEEAVYHVNNFFTPCEIELLPESFQATLFQTYVEKMYEIRVFIFGKIVNAMAIFSQKNENTKTDYRNYDLQKPTRCLPYKLPTNIEEKILKTMESLNLNTGSVDLIYTLSGDYVFLEINPVGQFGIVSRSGNYFIEKRIAEILFK